MLSIIRLHRIRVMQIIVTDVCSVCPSISLSVTRLNSALLFKNGWTDQDPIWCEHSWGPKEHCVKMGDLDPPQSREGDLMQITLATCYSGFRLYVMMIISLTLFWWSVASRGLKLNISVDLRLIHGQNEAFYQCERTCNAYILLQWSVTLFGSEYLVR